MNLRQIRAPKRERGLRGHLTRGRVAVVVGAAVLALSGTWAVVAGASHADRYTPGGGAVLALTVGASTTAPQNSTAIAQAAGADGAADVVPGAGAKTVTTITAIAGSGTATLDGQTVSNDLLRQISQLKAHGMPRMSTAQRNDEGGAALPGGAGWPGVIGEPGPFQSLLAYQGGPVLHQPKIYAIFWHWAGDPKADPDNTRDLILNFSRGIGASRWEATMSQYCDHILKGATTCAGAAPDQRIVGTADSLAGYWDDPDPIPANPNGLQMFMEALKARDHAQTADPNIEFAVFLPADHDPYKWATAGYCAYHTGGNMPYSFGNYRGTSLITVDVEPYVPNAGGGCGGGSVNCPAGQSGCAAGVNDGVTIAFGHEYAETATDPLPGAGWIGDGKAAFSNSDVAEIGDKCVYIQAGPGALANQSFSTGTFAMQSLWSNEENLGQGGCANAPQAVTPIPA